MMLYGHYMGRHCYISLLPLMLSLHLYIFPVPTMHGALAVTSHVVAAVSLRLAAIAATRTLAGQL